MTNFSHISHSSQSKQFHLGVTFAMCNIMYDLTKYLVDFNHNGHVPYFDVIQIRHS
jgi:hypothetical protein